MKEIKIKCDERGAIVIGDSVSNTMRSFSVPDGNGGILEEILKSIKEGEELHIYFGDRCPICGRTGEKEINYKKIWKSLKAEALRDAQESLYSEMTRLEANLIK